MFRTLLVSLSLVVALTAAPAQAADAPTATETLQTSYGTIVKMVDEGVDNQALQTEVDAFLDYKWIARSSLGGAKNYKKKCGERCDEFEALLTRLIRRNYTRRVEGLNKGTVEYLREEVRKQGTKAKVDTRITFTNKEGAHQEMKISYIMHLTDAGTWVCHNIFTDGVNMSKTYKTEFRKIYKKGGIDALIAQLETKLADVDADKAVAKN